jgi:hypothetical protein
MRPSNMLTVSLTLCIERDRADVGRPPLHNSALLGISTVLEQIPVFAGFRYAW